MSINLIKNELALADPDFRNGLVDNFTKIEKEINNLDSTNNGGQVTKEELNEKLDELKNDFMQDNEALKERINRILLGTDVKSIELVVNRILNEKGVSK
jgi:ABC-type Zn uptake system ZnuABC Zn-binding protein ZnuA